MKTRTHYIIYERPCGSTIWTQCMKGENVPMRFDSHESARLHAETQARRRRTHNGTSLCLRIVAVDLPAEPDTDATVTSADGDTTWRATE